MRAALDQYDNEDDPNYSLAYHVMVDMLNAWYNAGDWANDIANGVTEISAEKIEAMGGNDYVVKTLRGCADSAKTLKYDSILQEVIKGDYTASSGMKLSGSDESLTNLRRISTGLSGLRSLTKSLVAGGDITTDGEMTTEYLNEVLFPATDAYTNLLSSFSTVVNSDMDEETKNAVLGFSKLLTTAMLYDMSIVSYDNAGSLITETIPLFMMDDVTKAFVNLEDNAVKFASTTLDSYMYIQTIQTQKDTVAGPIKRTAQLTTNNAARVVLGRYVDLIEKAANEQTENFDVVLTTLKNSGVVTDITKKGTKAGFKALRNRAVPAYEKSVFPKLFAAWTNIVGSSLWLTDQVTGVKNTCLKTLELKNLDTLIDSFVDTYYEDLRLYQINPSEKYAKKVIDDLMFITRMRLRGETIAYKMAKGQWTSALGKLISGFDGETIEFWDDMYQQHVNALIGAAVSPMNMSEYVIQKGHTVEVVKAGNNLFAQCRDANGKQYRLAEIPYLFAGGVVVSEGAKLMISTTYCDCIPYIVNKGTVEFMSGIDYEIPDLTLSGGTFTTFNDKAVKIDCAHLETSNTTTVNNITVHNTENSNIGGSVNGGLFYFEKDVTGNSGYISDAIITSDSDQNITGTTYFGNLKLKNSKRYGIVASGKIGVKGEVENTDTKVRNSENITLVDGGSIKGDYYYGNITFESADVKGTKEIDGNLVLKTGTSKSEGLKIKGSVVQSSGKWIINGDIDAPEGLSLSGTVEQSEGNVSTKGNITGSGNVVLDNLNLCGKLQQSISCPITVNTFDYNNTHSSKVKLDARLTVAGELSLPTTVFSTPKNVVLTGKFADDAALKGAITLKDFKADFPDRYNGTIYFEGDNDIIGESIISGSVIHTSGTLNLKDADLTITGAYRDDISTEYPVQIDENSILRIKSDVSASSAFSGDGILEIYGNYQDSGTCNVAKMQCSGKLEQSVGNGFTTNEIWLNNGSSVNFNAFKAGKLVLEPYSTVLFNGNADIGVLELKNNSTVKANSTVSVTDKIVDEGAKITKKYNLQFTPFSEDYTFTEDTVFNDTLTSSKNLVIDGCTVTMNQRFNLTEGNISVINGGKLILNGISTISSGSGNLIYVDEYSSMNFKDLANINIESVNIDGEIDFNTDTVFTSTAVSGNGTVNIYGNVQLNSSSFNQLKQTNIIGSFAQSIGGGTMDFINLYIKNPTSVNFSTEATYSGELQTNKTKITGTVKKKTYSGDIVYNDDCTVNDILTLSGDLTVDGCTVILNKRFTMSAGNVNVINGGKLIVNSIAQVSSGSSYSITVDETSQLIFKKLANINASAMNVDGDVTFMSTALLSGASVQGDGTVNLYGDLILSNSAVNKPNMFKIIGYLPQSIGGGTMNFNNLFINNPKLITFTSGATYFGELTNENTEISGTLTQGN